MLTEAFNHLTAIPAYIWNRSDENAQAAKAALDKFSGLASTVQYISKYPAMLAGVTFAVSAGFKWAAKNDSVTFIEKQTYSENKDNVNKVIDLSFSIFKWSAIAWVASYATRNWVAPFVSGLVK